MHSRIRWYVILTCLTVIPSVTLIPFYSTVDDDDDDGILMMIAVILVFMLLVRAVYRYLWLLCYLFCSDLLLSIFWCGIVCCCSFHSTLFIVMEISCYLFIAVPNCSTLLFYGIHCCWYYLMIVTFIIEGSVFGITVIDDGIWNDCDHCWYTVILR